MDPELAYLAGFIDGEGHIAVGLNKNPGGKRRWYLRFACHQVNPAPLALLQRRFGGSIQKTRRIGNQRAIQEWSTTSMAAYEAIKALRPYLVVKAAEADVAIEFQELLLHRGTRRTVLLPHEEAARQDCYERMRALKHINYDET